MRLIRKVMLCACSQERLPGGYGDAQGTLRNLLWYLAMH